MLASSNSWNTLTKTFLHLPNRDPSWTWPPDEAPYRPPTQTASDSGYGTPPVTGQDPTTQPSTTNPPKVDPTLPAPTLGQVAYNAKTFKAVIPMTVLPDNKGDSTIFYLQRPGQAAVESFSIRASNSTSTSITISLDANGTPPIPGDYVLWAAFKNRNGSGVGPSSGSVKLTLTD